MNNEQLFEAIQAIAGDECVAINDDVITFTGIAATGKKDTEEHKTREFTLEVPTENLRMLALMNDTSFLSAIVRQTLTDERNKARKMLEVKAMPKGKAKVVRELCVDDRFSGMEDEMLEVLGYTEEQYSEALA